MDLAWPTDWRDVLQDVLAGSAYEALVSFVQAERESANVFPAEAETFRAFELTPFDSVRVVILGQDPYHGAGQANGLCFSVHDGVPIPPSLRNIFRERESDLGLPPPVDGSLDAWARQGVLMLNTVLTVRESEANSHRKQGWEEITDEVIRQLDRRHDPPVFVLWGKPAQKKLDLIDSEFVVQSAHPSPLSASRGFFGSRPFSQVNEHLAATGATPIDWRVASELPV